MAAMKIDKTEDKNWKQTDNNEENMKCKKSKDINQRRSKAEEITEIEKYTKKSEKQHNVNKPEITTLAHIMTMKEKTEGTETKKTTTMTRATTTKAEDEKSNILTNYERNQTNICWWWLLHCNV